MNPNDAEVKAKRPTTLKEKFWPSVSTSEEARQSARHGMWAAYTNGILSILVIVAVFISSDVREFVREMLEITPGEQDSILGFLILVVLEAIIFLVLGFAIGKMSRVAAVLALALYFLDRIVMPPANAGGIIFAVAFLWLYALGIRGTFAWHRLTKQG